MNYKQKAQLLLQSAIKNHTAAYAKEAAANSRREEIRVREFNNLKHSAAAGNDIARAKLRKFERGQTSSFEVDVDVHTSNDAVWKAHVANNQFYIRKADTDTGLAQALLLALQLGILKGDDQIAD